MSLGIPSPLPLEHSCTVCEPWHRFSLLGTVHAGWRGISRTFDGEQRRFQNARQDGLEQGQGSGEDGQRHHRSCGSVRPKHLRQQGGRKRLASPSFDRMQFPACHHASSTEFPLALLSSMLSSLLFSPPRLPPPALPWKRSTKQRGMYPWPQSFHELTQKSGTRRVQGCGTHLRCCMRRSKSDQRRWRLGR